MKGESWNIWMGPKDNSKFTYKRGRQTQREDYTTPEADTGVMWPQAMECCSHQKLGRRGKNSSLEPPEGG